MTRLNRRRVMLASALALPAAVPGFTATADTTPSGSMPSGSMPCGSLPIEPVPAQVRAREGFLDVPGARLWFWDTGGHGPAVVLVHPGSGSALSWPYQQPVFAKAGYRVIAYSRRGHYKSTQPAPGNPGVGADDLHALVNHLGLRKFHLLGAALGGYYATDYALLHPERVLSLVILSSFMGISDPEYLRVTEWLRPPGFSAMRHDFLELSPYYRAANEAGARTWLEISDKSLGGHTIESQTLSEPISWARLETLAVRTLLLGGDADLYLPPPILRMISAHLPRSSSVVYGKVGHSASWERPGEFNRDVLKFLSGGRFPRETCR